MKKIFKSMISLAIILSMLSTMVWAETSEVNPVVTAEIDAPSNWAIWDVQMAYTYGLGDEITYSGYKKAVKGAQFLLIEADFEEKFEAKDVTKIEASASVTRGTVITELYDIISSALSIEMTQNKDDALQYFIDNQLINGREKGDYRLDALITNQEMLVFAKRVYDYLSYELNMDSKGTFWKVSDEDNTVYLLGSIHVADQTTYPLSRDILESFAAADELVVEANILVPNPEDTLYIQQIMMLKGDLTIDQVITKTTYDKYVKAIAPLGLTPEVYNKLKPWYAAMLLQNIQLSSNNYSTTMGIDLYLMYLANNWKPIVELEGVKYQLDMFDSFSMDLQEGYLQGVLEGSETAETSTDLVGEMMAQWKAGDVKKLETTLFATEAVTELEKEFSNKVWDVRNKHMSSAIHAMLKDEKEKDFFVVVGAGHMLNNNGIIKSLEAIGYKVEQVK